MMGKEEGEERGKKKGDMRGRVGVKHISTLAHYMAWREADGLWGDELQKLMSLYLYVCGVCGGEGGGVGGGVQ